MSHIIKGESHGIIKTILNITMITSTPTLWNGNIRVYATRISVSGLFATPHRESGTS